jgi:hypothetical protein
MSSVDEAFDYTPSPTRREWGLERIPFQGAGCVHFVVTADEF